MSAEQGRSPENDAPQWAVQAEDGTIARSSEEIAKRAASESGWTLGIERSPVVAALTRAASTDDWVSVIPPAKGNPGGAS